MSLSDKRDVRESVAALGAARATDSERVPKPEVEAESGHRRSSGDQPVASVVEATANTTGLRIGVRAVRLGYEDRAEHQDGYARASQDDHARAHVMFLRRGVELRVLARKIEVALTSGINPGSRQER